MFSSLRKLTYNELFQDPKTVGEPYKRKLCSSFYYALILIGCDYSKGNGCETSDMKTQQWNKSTHLTNHAKWKYLSNEK